MTQSFVVNGSEFQYVPQAPAGATSLDDWYDANDGQSYMGSDPGADYMDPQYAWNPGLTGVPDPGVPYPSNGEWGGVWDNQRGVYLQSNDENVDADDSSGTDTDTSSDSYESPIGPVSQDLPPNATTQQVAEVLWANYKNSKKKWRRFTQKTTRKTRRFVKTSFGKGRGKGGKRATAYLNMPDVQA